MKSNLINGWMLNCIEAFGEGKVISYTSDNDKVVHYVFTVAGDSKPCSNLSFLNNLPE